MQSNGKTNSTAQETKLAGRPTYSTRLKTVMESNITSGPENAALIKMGGEFNQQLQGLKRKADVALAKQHPGAKRFALGNLTNAETEHSLAQGPQKTGISVNKLKKSNDAFIGGGKIKGATKILTRAAMRLEQQQQALANGRKQQQLQTLENQENVIKIDHPPPTKQAAGGDVKVMRTRVPYRSSQDEKNRQNAQQQQQQQPDSKQQPDGKQLKPPAAGRTSDTVAEHEESTLYASAIDTLEGEEGGTVENGGGKPAAAASVKLKGPTAAQQKKSGGVNIAVKFEAPTAISKNVAAAPRHSNAAVVGQKKKPLSVEAALAKKRMSSEFELSDDSLYVSAIDSLEGDASAGGRLSEKFANAAAAGIKALSVALPSVSSTGKENQTEKTVEEKKLPSSIAAEDQSTSEGSKSEATGDELRASPRKCTPPGVADFDKSTWRDIFQVAEYAQDIFEYLRERESLYILPDYMVRQKHVSVHMRALLVDWMVEIQESFELNHETLYLAVKIVDSFLSLVIIQRETLQLVAAAALLIAAKFDERVPPTLDDFIYICDGAYERPELVKMERTVFRAISFDLGYPLSYRFLRRYARVNGTPMETLTLARFVLETSLMEYATVLVRDSKLACAALFIALRMSDKPGWNATLEHYSGYKVDDFKDVVILLNNGIVPRKTTLNTVRQKYSHSLFFHVAKRPVITCMKKMFDSTNTIEDAGAEQQQQQQPASAEAVTSVTRSNSSQEQQEQQPPTTTTTTTTTRATTAETTSAGATDENVKQ